MKPSDSSGSQKKDPVGVGRATVWLFLLTLFRITLFWILTGAIVVSFSAMVAVHAMPANL